MSAWPQILVAFVFAASFTGRAVNRVQRGHWHPWMAHTARDIMVLGCLLAGGFFGSWSPL